MHALLGVAGRVSLNVPDAAPGTGFITRAYVALVDKDHQEVDRGRCLCSAVELFTKSPEGPRQPLISARRLGAGTQPSLLSGAPNGSRRNPKRCVHQRSRDRPPAAEALRGLPSSEKRPAESESWRTCRVWGPILFFGKPTARALFARADVSSCSNVRYTSGTYIAL